MSDSKNNNLSDMLGDLHTQLNVAMAENDLDRAKDIRRRLVDLLDDGKENDSIDIDLDDEFVKNWYQEGW